MKRGRTRRRPNLGRLRTAVKRQGIVSALLVGEVEAWRSRILVLEQREHGIERYADEDLEQLAGAGWPA